MMNMLEDWAILESDFRREYGIDLLKARLSWRAFFTLVQGLGSESNWVLTYQGRQDGSVPIENDEAAERAFSNF